MRLLDAPQLLELRRNFLVDLYLLGHDLPRACLLALTRQHERMDVKRFGDILNAHARQLAEPDGAALEPLAVTVRRPRSWSSHLTLLIVRSGWPPTGRSYPFRSNRLLDREWVRSGDIGNRSVRGHG